ncbi:MAG: peptidoglycan-binding protein [Actinobacteria bacterium]|nr:peptidoglycan-binding protein [Actinomycetota bacterium]
MSDTEKTGMTRRPGARRTLAVAATLGLAAGGGIVAVAPAIATGPAVVRPAAKPVLQIGATGKKVVRLQRKIGVSPATGYFGPVTLAAVKSFQAAHGVPTTGVVASMTWAAIRNQSAAPTPARAPAASSVRTKRPKLRMGMTHPAVTKLQRRMRMPQVTGYFGPLTDSYVRSLQAKAGLRVTGVVNKNTWRKSKRIVVPTPSAASAPAPAANSSSSQGIRKRILSIAASYQGVPYVAGGYTPEQGFNCSSYTQWVYQQAGIDLGGAYTVTQYANAQKIDRSQARKGDLIFYYNYKNNFLGHVGIYAGGNKFWHAPRTGRVVSLDQIYSDKVLFARVV